MEKRLLIAIALSMLVLLFYPVILAKIYPPRQMDFKSYHIAQQKVIEVEESKPKDKISRKEFSEPPHPETIIKGEKYASYISNLGGSIYKIILNGAKRDTLILVDKAFYEAGILSIEGKGILSGLSSQKFTIENAGTALYTELNNIMIEKNIATPHSYSLYASVKITNFSDEVQALSFDITTASNISKIGPYETRYIEGEILFKDGTVKKINYHNLLKNNRIYKNNIEWIALKNKYYTIIAKPISFEPKGIFIKEVSGNPVIGFIIEDDKLYKKESRLYNIYFYLGPMDIKELEKSDPNFTRVIHFGFLTGIGLLLLGILNFLSSIFHNYGLAIIALTFIINIFLYPLTFKSLKSMHKLQSLQPQVERLRLEYKDSPQKFNKEIMELYRRHNVNPMTGCMPMILQMPVFIALYNVLSRSIELKNAGFLWIKDLSMPDAFISLNGFQINLLPILMICAMIIQQRFSPTHTKFQTSDQKLMSWMMILMFGVLFYGLPSGLVLYWFTSTFIATTIQFFIFRKISHD